MIESSSDPNAAPVAVPHPASAAVTLDDVRHVAAIQPMAQVSELLNAAPALAGSSLRADAIAPSVDRAAVMQEAPETDGRFFKVPKVIER